MSPLNPHTGRTGRSPMIHALPGMGANQHMYPAPWAQLPGFVAHDWMRHDGEQSLPEVARSMCTICGIQDGDMLIGSSLGGMVACEITKLRRIPALYLCGSAVCPAEVSALLAAIHPLARIAPFDWLRFSAETIPTDFAQMFAGIEASFVRAMCAAIFQWEGLGDSPTPVWRIHGRNDRVIPPPPKVDLLLEGGHLIALSHAEACVAYIQAHLPAGPAAEAPCT